MVIGNGMVAKKFEAYKTKEEIIIFASGVSNSKNTDAVAFDREYDFLTQTVQSNANKQIVYFSTCSILDPGESESAYVQHKERIENFLQQSASRYHIFRVSNLVGHSTNKNTVLNFFYHHIKEGINFEVWTNATRNIIDIDDMFLLVDHILQQQLFPNQVINIANPATYTATEIVKALELNTGLTAHAIPIQKGIPFSIDISLILPLIDTLKLPFGETYLADLIKKYYAHS